MKIVLWVVTVGTVVVVVADVVVVVVVVVLVEVSSAVSVCGLVIVVAVLLVVLSCVDVAKMLDAGCGIWLHVFQSKSRWNVVQHVPIVYAIKVVLWI